VKSVIGSILIVSLALVVSVPAASQHDLRTVTPSETGLIFAYPNGFTWRDVGAYVGTPGSEYFARMSPGALKIQHGRFQHFCPADDNHFAFFPYSRLKEFEAQEVLAGRPPFFVTATYQGKKRPVYFAWSLDLHDNVPKAPAENWMQAVDVSSDRYLDFWINQYVRHVLWKNRYATSSQWVGIDNCAFRLDLYGVIDDNGRFVTEVPWDPPFPRTADQYVAAVRQFFHKLAERAPDIKTMCNIGSLKDWSQFQYIYDAIPGVMAEDLADADKNPREFARRGESNILTALSWFGSLGRVAVLRAIVARGSVTDIRTGYAVYLLVRGPNFFFAPEFSDSAAAVPKDQWELMHAALGDPTDSMKITPDRPKGSPYNLYSRTCQRGIVYVNWTGRTQQIALPGTDRYLDVEGKPVTSLTLPDLTGTYVTVGRFRQAHNGNFAVAAALEE
jgi:hypothetical protein